MMWIHVVWLAVGVVLGVLHAAGISHAAKQPTMFTPVIGVARLLIVGLGLAAAAVFGGIVPAAAGWAGGFLVSVVIVSCWKVPTATRRADEGNAAHNGPAADTRRSEVRSGQ